MSQCTPSKGSTTRSVVLALRLVGATIESREEIVQRVLEDQRVRSAFHEVLKTQAKSMVTAKLEGTALDAANAVAFGTTIAKAMQRPLSEQVRAQPEFRSLNASLERLKCDVARSPMGVYVDEHRNWLIVTGVLVGVAGAVAIYRVREGTVAGAGLAKLAESSAEKIEVGSVTFSLSGLKFDPGRRDLAGTAKLKFGKLPLHKVQTSFKLEGAVKAGQLDTLKAGSTVVVPLSAGIQLTGTSSAGMKAGKPASELALGIKYKLDGQLEVNAIAFSKQEKSTHTIGSEFKSSYRFGAQHSSGAPTTTLDFSGSLKKTLTGSEQKTGVEVRFGFTRFF